MSKLTADSIDIGEIRQRVERELKLLVDRTTRKEGISQIRVEIPAIDPLRWLELSPALTKFYWQSRYESRQIAAVGSCYQSDWSDRHSLNSLLKGLQELLDSSDENVRCLGGFSFDFSRKSHEKREGELPMVYFAVPLIQFEVTNDAAHLVINKSSTTPIDEIRRHVNEAIDSLRESQRERFDIDSPEVNSRKDNPDLTSWSKEIEQVLAGIKEQTFNKIVLARQTKLKLTKTINPWAILGQLRTQGEGKFLFGFQYDGGPAFVGASPEMLYRREGNAISSEAIAGTRQRGHTTDDDNRLTEELSSSVKDRLEHQIVVDHVKAALEPLCIEFSPAETDDNLKLPYLQHIIRRFTGKLCEGVTDADLLAALHPTPAVGGSPGGKAKEILRQLEPFDRGWYAGPVGWISRDAAEFAVAIRSALVRENELKLYSGAGIVAGSVPEHEWQELESKIQPFLKALKESP